MKRLTLLALALTAAVLPPAHAGQGAALIDLRLRHEAVDDAAFARDAEATTYRARLGYKWAFTPEWSVLAELEHTGHVFGERYNSTANRRTRYPSVVDPDNTELNQALINWTPNPNTRATLGRQRLIYGNQRFIGNVGWRDNEQTFDAVDGQYTFGNGATLRYSYLDRVLRVFGDDHPNRNLARWDLDAHLFDAGVKLGPGLLNGYLHLFENETLPLASHKNLGLRYAAQGGPADGLGWSVTAEFARQRPYADGARINDAEYGLIEGGLRWSGHQFSAGYERLGGDGRYGFQTPFATLHAFNGWADRFLTTPVNGIEDRYVGWKRAFGAVTANLVWHDFQADRGGADYGDEWNASLAWAFKPGWNALLKFARYDSDGFGADVDKLWLSLEYKR